MTDRELLQMASTALSKSLGWDVELDKHIGAVLYFVRERLNEHEPLQVRPHEFLKAVEGKENLIGKPMMMSVWPTNWPTTEKNT